MLSELDYSDLWARLLISWTLSTQLSIDPRYPCFNKSNLIYSMWWVGLTFIMLSSACIFEFFFPFPWYLPWMWWSDESCGLRCLGWRTGLNKLGLPGPLSDGLSLWTWPLIDVDKPSDHPFAPLPSLRLLLNRWEGKLREQLMIAPLQDKTVQINALPHNCLSFQIPCLLKN